MYLHQNASHFGEIKIHPKLTLILILAAIALVFIAQNSTIVETDFLLWSVSMSNSLLIFLTLATGFALGWLTQGYLLYRKYKRDSVYFSLRR